MEKQIKLFKKNLVDINSILLCQADANYTQIFFKDGTKYLSAHTLAVFQKKLCNDNFFRPNRSVIINLAAIDLSTYRLGDESVFLKNKMEITISRKRKKDFKTMILANHQNYNI